MQSRMTANCFGISTADMQMEVDPKRGSVRSRLERGGTISRMSSRMEEEISTRSLRMEVWSTIMKTDTRPANGSFLPARTLATGWQNFRQIIPAGGGVILAITQEGKLLWYRHYYQSTGNSR